MSKALMGAATRAICNGLNVNQYCEMCFNALLRSSVNILPTCFIRNDIAHFIQMICRWKCFQSSGKTRLKEFYVRCARLLLQSRTLDEFSKILTSTLTIAYSETEDAAKYSLTFIIELLEGQSYEKENDLTSYSDLLAAPEIEDIYEEEIELNTSSSIITFLNNINHTALSAASVIQHSVTTKINAYFLDDFGKNMVKLCSTFPIWSNVMVDLFGCPNITASSAPIESDFNNLKNRILKNESKPMKVDRSDIFIYLFYLNN